VNTIGKEYFTSLYSPTRARAFTLKNIKAGFAVSGLFPLNPDRVLRSMPAPPAKPAISSADEVKVGSCRQDVEPQTLVTLVSAEAFMLLQNLIIQDAHALDETSKQKLVRHLQKGTKAFQKSSALEKLQEDCIQFLTTINNEAKVRRSTKALVLGKAKVMSYEDLVEARAKRVEKESAQGAKGKTRRGRKLKSSPPAPLDAEEGTADTARRGRKRKSSTPEADEGTVDTPRRSRKRQRSVQDPPEPSNELARAQIVSEPWRAPVAQMY
jgi:hypothetical protein